jgi:predicted Zn-dependent protease
MAPRAPGERPGPPRQGTDVYHRGSPAVAPPGTDGPPVQPPNVAPVNAAKAHQHWEGLLRRQRWTNRLFGAAIALFAGGVILAMVHFQQIKNNPVPAGTGNGKPLPGESTPQGIKIQTRNALDADGRASLTFLVDDLRDVNTRTEAPPGGADLETTWVKLAGAELVKAERAMREGQADRALHHFQRAADIFPTMKGVQAYIGLLHLQNQRFETAIAHLGRAAAENPLDHSLLNNIGVAYMALKQYGEAEKYFTECTRLNPKYPMGWYNLASLFFEQQDYARSAAVLPTYLNLEGANLEAAQMYARSLIALLRWREAAEVLGQIAKQQPGVAPVQFRLAQCLSMSGDTAGGMQALARGVSLVDRTQALAWLSRNDFNQLRAEPGFQALVTQLNLEK